MMSAKLNLSEDYINEYLADLGGRGSKRCSTKRYGHVLYALLEFYEKEYKNENFWGCSRIDVINFKLQLARALAPVTVNFYLVVIREFFRYLYKRGISEDVTIGIENLRVEKIVPSFVRGQELNQLFELTDRSPGIFVRQSPRSAMLNARDVAIFEVVIGTGITASELCEIKQCEVNSTEGYLIVPARESKTSRIIPLPRKTLDAVKKYSEYREKVFQNSPHFFLYRTGAKFCRECVHRVCSKFLNQTGSKKKGPQTLRNTYINVLSTRGANIQSIKYLAGHSAILSTMKYSDLS